MFPAVLFLRTYALYRASKGALIFLVSFYAVRQRYWIIECAKNFSSQVLFAIDISIIGLFLRSLKCKIYVFQS
jgi:hypothetical protein